MTGNRIFVNKIEGGMGEIIDTVLREGRRVTTMKRG